jgi:hypothetical protein
MPRINQQTNRLEAETSAAFYWTTQYYKVRLLTTELV